MAITPINKLYSLLDQCMLTDRQGFYRRIQSLNKQPANNEEQQKLAHKISQSIEKANHRAQSVPNITFPESLPISQKRELIADTIRNNQVTILCGETGSGKTTQLPKLCLELGLGIRGLIGHTQPRRLAARSVADRIAEELNSELGQAVGYKVRFTDKLSNKSYIKLMTDGILLAECHHDPYLNQYDTIIIDEAHERSLNIDFLLGYLKRLLPKRPDLKLIITSATIDPARFSNHFDQAPVIEVSGRTYPVEVRYHSLHVDNDDEVQKDLQQGIIDAISELSKIDRSDILVFLSGEQDIRETTQTLQKLHLDNTDILPLLARLSATEQNKIFHTSSKRRIILATNVAETSLTVPGIKYVIDSGVARISRYSWRSKIQRLPIEKISQASANQRKGRCGRISEGICIRLYSEEDFNNRAEFTEPEIQRTNLASVILQMEHLNLGHIDDFPFVEPPDSRLINDGYKLLIELGALNNKHKATKTGRKLARLPIDPRLGRMLVESEQENALNEVLIIISALATQDPRERPMDKRQAADEAHKPFTDSQSDFLFYLNLWNTYHSQKENLSGNKLRKWCKQNFLSWMRIREWIDTHKQITFTLKDLKFKFNQQTANYDSIHKSLITGLLANIGLKDEGKEFTGARNKKFNIFPGSGLFKKPPKWIMAAEIIETSRVYARTNAKIETQWIEQKAKHLLKYSYNNPHWEKRSSRVTADEQSSLYGLVINPRKKVNYASIDPVETRSIFIRSALAQYDFDCNVDFFLHNKNLIEELLTLESKSRRQDILVDEDTLFHFYDAIIPKNVNDGFNFHKWVKACNNEELKNLYLNKDSLMQHDASHITEFLFPDHLTMNDCQYPLEYNFDPGNHCDGITLITPQAGINNIDARLSEWLVPGMLREKIIQLIRSLPKSLRRNFVPAPNFADTCIDSLHTSNTPLCTAVSSHLKKITGVDIPYNAWRIELIDPHLFINFRVIDDNGNTIKETRDLSLLKDNHPTKDNKPLKITPDNDRKEKAGPEIFDDFPETEEKLVQGVKIKIFPGLTASGKDVFLQFYNSFEQAQSHHIKGIRQLFINSLTDQIQHLKKNLPDINKICLNYVDFGTCDSLKKELINSSIDDLFTNHKISSYQDFKSTLDNGKPLLFDSVINACSLLNEILVNYRAIKKAFKNPPLDWLDTVTDIKNQLDYLLFPGFLLEVKPEWLEHYPRYLIAITKRLEKIRSNPAKDRESRLKISTLWNDYIERENKLKNQLIHSEQLEYYRWMLEEYRVSLFSQELKTLFPISEKRLKKYWNEISDV
jgi:ATP-dependent RNA helicase HrpA